MDPAEEQRQADVERLRRAFAAAFDEGWLRQLLGRPAQELGRRLEFLGEGAHAAAWKVKAAESKGASKAAVLPLVLKRLTTHFAPPGSPRRRQWTEALASLRGTGGTIPLIPPFAVLVEGDEVGMAMPFGEAPLASASPHWQPTAARIKELEAALARRGLELGDVPQGRCWQGVPFLFDFSDLGLRR